jgi:hypothetical protein
MATITISPSSISNQDNGPGSTTTSVNVTPNDEPWLGFPIDGWVNFPSPSAGESDSSSVTISWGANGVNNPARTGKVRFELESNPSIHADFTIGQLAGDVATMEVTQPTSGELLLGTAWKTIRWENNEWSSTPNVRIRVYKGGTMIEQLHEQTPNDEAYSWQVNADYESGTDYRIRVDTSPENWNYPYVDDYSPYFEIQTGGNYGVRINNQWGDIQIDSTYKNYRVVQEGSFASDYGGWSGGFNGSNSHAAGNGRIDEFLFDTAISDDDGNLQPLVAIKPTPMVKSSGAPTFTGAGLMSYCGLIKSGNNWTGFKMLYGISHAHFGLSGQYKVLLPGASDTPGEYGIQIDNAWGQPIFNSNNQNLAVIQHMDIGHILVDLDDDDWYFDSQFSTHNGLHLTWNEDQHNTDNPVYGGQDHTCRRNGIAATGDGIQDVVTTSGSIIQWQPILDSDGNLLSALDKWFLCGDSARWWADWGWETSYHVTVSHKTWFTGQAGWFVCSNYNTNYIGWAVNVSNYLSDNVHYLNAVPTVSNRNILVCDLNGGSI